MMVNKFEIVPNEEGTFKLLINGVLISNYFYYLESEYKNLIQIDVCSHCFYPGCSDYGYIEVLDLTDIIIWKVPLNDKLSFSNREFNSLSALSKGPIYWPRHKYNELVNTITQLNRSTYECYGTRPKLIDIKDIWRTEGSLLYRPGSFETYAIQDIFQNRMGMYHEILSEKQCEVLFEEAWKTDKFNRIEIVELDTSMKPIVMMFDDPEYREWKCLFISDNAMNFSIGEGLLVSVS